MFGSVEYPPAPVLDDAFWMSNVGRGSEAEDDCEERVVAARQVGDELLDRCVSKPRRDRARDRVDANRRDDNDEDKRELIVEIAR